MDEKTLSQSNVSSFISVSTEAPGGSFKVQDEFAPLGLGEL
jgi:hypothetical protein